MSDKKCGLSITKQTATNRSGFFSHKTENVIAFATIGRNFAACISKGEIGLTPVKLILHAKLKIRNLKAFEALAR